MAHEDDSELPFSRYEGAGRVLLGRPRPGDGTCRGGYGLAVIEQSGSLCCYCGLDLGAAYAAWLNLSVDHVVPRMLVGQGWPGPWIEDLINFVASCRACNEFLNGYRVVRSVAPATLDEFLEVRDRVFVEKRLWVLERHLREQQRYQAWRTSPPMSRPASQDSTPDPDADQRVP